MPSIYTSSYSTNRFTFSWERVTDDGQLELLIDGGLVGGRVHLSGLTVDELLELASVASAAAAAGHAYLEGRRTQAGDPPLPYSGHVGPEAGATPPSPSSPAPAGTDDDGAESPARGR